MVTLMLMTMMTMTMMMMIDDICMLLE